MAQDMAKNIKQNGLANARGLGGRLPKYIAVVSAFFSVLNALAVIDTMQKLLAHGTALPKEQAEADKVAADSQEAKKWAISIDDDIHRFAWMVIIGESTAAGDDQSLLQMDIALHELRQPIDASGRELREIADDLTRTVATIKTETNKQFKDIFRFHGPETGSNAIALAMHESLQKLGGTVSTAATTYGEAAEAMERWAAEIKMFEDEANAAAWEVRQQRARQELEARKGDGGG
jgi:hypothetical protein